MKLKSLYFLIVMILAFGCTQPKTSKIFETSKNYPEQLRQLHQNVLVNIFNAPVDLDEIKQLLDGMQENGSWANIDYTSNERGGWPQRGHLTNLLEIAKAYQTIGTDFYQKKDVSRKIHLSLNFWLENDFICPNWWYPIIGVPMILNPILILMEAELSKEQLEKGLAIVNRCNIGRTGQNKVWQSGNVLLTSLLIKDVEMVQKASASIKEELVVSTNEGVQPDWSYHQHGPQLQFGNYGLAYVGDMIKWISILRKTPFNFDESKVSILRNYLLKGQQWVTWKNQMDISACGRQLGENSPESKAASLYRSVEKMETLDPEFSGEYKKANKYDNLTGNKHFWRSDFQVQRTPDYYFSVKMCSERVIGAESCNAENIQGYYMGDGATYLYQTGDEYRNIFPFWDWRKIPGTTTQQDDEILPVLTARGYRIESNFVGGVSDGENGIAVMDYNRNGLKARKSWFMFDNKVVCLGAGISLSQGLLVTTSINQSFLKGDVEQKTNNNKSGKSLVFDWILHDNIGYVFPVKAQVNVETGAVEGAWNKVTLRYSDKKLTSNIFKLWFDHGVNPKDETYNYILVPNATKTILEEMEKQLPFEIVNRKNRQEVVSTNGLIAGIIFYEPGKSDVFGGIEVDQPCLVMLKKHDNGLQVSVADPTQKLSEINLILNDEYFGEFATSKNKKTEIKIALQKGGESGKTVTLELTKR
ncbi:MAG: polysaccharide lyase 8 family protein [Draconibacterium sp.]|nr:polysaccharide lyase 8 family protein [Draconibacterium sp.]